MKIQNKILKLNKNLERKKRGILTLFIALQQQKGALSYYNIFLLVIWEMAILQKRIFFLIYSFSKE